MVSNNLKLICFPFRDLNVQALSELQAVEESDESSYFRIMSWYRHDIFREMQSALTRCADRRARLAIPALI